MNTITMNTLLLLTIALSAGGCAQLIGLEKPDDSDPDDRDAGGGDPVDAATPPEADAAGLPRDSVRRVFVTEGRYTGALGGLAGADQICQTEAMNAQLGGEWIAWLADGTDSPSTRFVQGTNEYRRLDGMAIASNWDALIDGTLDVPLNHTPTGMLTPGERATWTNVTADGQFRDRLDEGHCAGWTDETGNALTGYSGENNKSDSTWTLFGDFLIFCDSDLHLYCFER